MRTDEFSLSFFEQLAKGIAGHFGTNCEVSIYDVHGNNILVIENGHVTDRKTGDKAPKIILNAIRKNNHKPHSDNISFISKTSDERILKSTIMYIKNKDDELLYLFTINFDITSFSTLNTSLSSLMEIEETPSKPIGEPKNINDILDELMVQSTKLIGKPVSKMTRDDKIKAVHFLNETGAFLITKSGDKISKYLGISKFTLYNYLDEEQNH